MDDLIKEFRAQKAINFIEWLDKKNIQQKKKVRAFCRKIDRRKHEDRYKFWKSDSHYFEREILPYLKTSDH